MAGAVDFPPGGYRFLPSVFQYSAGVAALPGHAIERVRFRAPMPLEAGFAAIERMITQAGRPLTAFCGCELRSPAPFTEEGFRSFNERYVVTLEKWRLFDGKVNPVARSNVCPDIEPPSEPSFHAFSFTVAASSTAPSLRDCRRCGSERGRSKLQGAHRQTGRHDARCHARKGVPCALRDGTPTGGDRVALGGHHGHSGLHRSQPLSFSRRRDRAPRCRPCRADVALCPAAGARARIRDGLPGNEP